MSNIRKKRKKDEKRLTPSSYIIMIAIPVFIVMALLLFQHSSIYETNAEIRELQETLEEAIQENDSKAGQLVTNMNLQAIEGEARSYGMKEPVQEQYRREIIKPLKDRSSQDESGIFLEWLRSLF